jgi:hypothetical protein
MSTEATVASSEDSLKRVLGRLAVGAWAFELIYPSYRKSLESHFQRSEKFDSNSRSSVFAMNCFRYRPLLQLPRELIADRDSMQIVCTGELVSEEFWKIAVSLSHANAKFYSWGIREMNRVVEALSVIKKHAPQTFEQVSKFISYIVPFENANTRSFSHPHFFGCIFIRPSQSPIQLAVSIVHELAHQELFFLNLIDRLVQKSADYSLAHAPFQGKPRPPIGRLHAAHALFRMVQFESDLLPENAEIHRQVLHQTIATFATGELTAFAEILCQEIYVQSDDDLERSIDLPRDAEVGNV